MTKIWTKEQNDAIYTNGNNILVSASAGSGKTAILIERIINKIINEKLDVDKILVVTFTNAAACELKERLQRALFDEIKKDNKNYHLKKQLSNINNASITTIHSFCLEVIRNNFYKIGLDPNFSICDDIKSKLLKRNALEEILEEEYKNYNEEEFGLYNILQLFNMDEDELLNCISKIINEIDCYESPFLWLEEKINKYNIDDINQDLCFMDFGREIYSRVISNFKVVLTKSTDFRNKLLEKKEEFFKYIELLDEDINNIRRVVECSNNSWDDLYDNLKMISFSNMPRTKVTDEYLKEEFSNLRKNVIKQEVSNANSYIYDKSSNILNSLRNMYPYLRYIYNFTDKVYKRYIRMKNEENMVDFSDIEHYALDILLDKNEKSLKLEPSLEAQKYKNKFEEIYIDEYQDTSYMQEAILNSISRENPGNKFMVGDVKQSIYKFRHAVTKIFTEKYNKYSKLDEEKNDKNGNKIILAKNFRSRREVLDGINYIFEQIMSDDMGDCNYTLDEVLTFGQTSYLNDGEDYSFEINILDKKDNIDESNFDDEALQYVNELKTCEQEAIFVANRIHDLVNKEKFKIMKNGNLVSATYSDICILLRSTKSKAEIYENALKSKNIPVYSSSSINLWDNDEVRLVLSFLKILDNPLQDVEIVSLMYSIIGKFTLDEIYYIRHKDIKNNLYSTLINWDFEHEHNLELNNKIKYFVDLINEYTAYLNVLTVSEIISRLYTFTDIYSYVLLLENPNIRKMNLDSLITVASNADKASSVSEFILYIEALKDKMIDSPETSKTIGENENVVRIMTIHKSKGLEFPIVILASCSSKYSSNDIKDRVLLSDKFGIGIDILNEDLKFTYPSIIKQAIKYEIIEQNKSEELRMLYVALTRAKEKLITYLYVNDLEKKMDKIYPIYNEKGKIDKAISIQNNSYTDVILMGIKKYYNTINIDKNLFTINHILINSEESVEKILKSKNEDIKPFIIRLSEKIENCNISDKNLYSNEIIDNLLNNYQYEDETHVLRRIGVSKLKQMYLKEYDNLSNNSDTQFNLKIPNCIASENESKINIKGARKGTLIHYILENMDYYKVKDIDSLKEYIEELERNNKITLEEKKVINLDKLVVFLNSSLANNIRKSSNIKKEVEFVLNNSKYTKSTIQGVIDLYFENADGTYTLVDFKTDKIDNKEEFMNKYGIQLDMYKEAIENITKKKVNEVYIYSFNLNKEIKMI